MWLPVFLIFIATFTGTTLVDAGLAQVGRSCPQPAIIDYAQDPKRGNSVLRRAVCGYVQLIVWASRLLCMQFEVLVILTQPEN